MGLLAGFVLFYSVLGIPIARLADRFNRRNVVAIALAFWSAITVLCGMAHRVATLAPARIGVGESGGTPASQSIIADLFSKHQRPRARIYAIGTYLGVFLGYFIGGYNNQYYGWRMAFHTAGLPGLALAAVLWLTIQEPKRGAMAETFTPEPIGPTLDFLALQRTFVILLAGFCLTTYFPTMVAALAATSFLVGFQLGPIFAIAQTVARPSMLALALAIMLLTAAGFGQGIGPLAAGMLNNALKNDFGAQAVGYSLLSAAVTATVGALLFIRAARSIRRDISARASARRQSSPFLLDCIKISPSSRVGGGSGGCRSVRFITEIMTKAGQKPAE